jgi:hypothetical protein
VPKNQTLCHEIEPNPSKDRAMHEGDNPSFWNEFIKFTFFWQNYSYSYFKQVPKYLNSDVKNTRYCLFVFVMSLYIKNNTIAMNGRFNRISNRCKTPMNKHTWRDTCLHEKEFKLACLPSKDMPMDRKHV